DGTRVPTDGDDLIVRQVTGDWSPDTLTHNRRPAVDPALVVARSRPSPTTVHPDRVAIELDSVPLVAGASVSLQVQDSGPGATLRLQRLGAEVPTLLLTFEPAGTAVDDLQPTVHQQLAVDGADGTHSSKQMFAHYFPPYPISIDNE